MCGGVASLSAIRQLKLHFSVAGLGAGAGQLKASAASTSTAIAAAMQAYRDLFDVKWGLGVDLLALGGVGSSSYTGRGFFRPNGGAAM